MKTTNLENITQNDLIPLGKINDQEILALSPEEQAGIMLMFGRSGQGRSVALKQIVIANMLNDRSGLFIEPYGDLFQDIQNYIPDELSDQVIIFEAGAGSFEDNKARLEKENVFPSLKENKPKFILCKIDYRTIGVEEVIDLGRFIVKQYLQNAGNQNHIIALDEAHNFIDDEIVAEMIANRDHGLSCILSNQTGMDYRTDILESLLVNASHIISYFTDPYTAKTINKHYPDINPEQISNLVKYHSLALLNIKTNSPATNELNGIHPVPYRHK